MFKNKLVPAINKSCDPGVAMNAVTHMSLGLSQMIDKDEALSL